MSSKSNGLEKILWSIAIPGFGQLLNKKYIKGLVLIVLEICINLMSKLNTAIIFSFHGKTQSANEITNYYWLMYYPCIYFFSIWDAYKDATEDPKPFLVLPFVFAAYFSTVGVIYSDCFKIFDFLLGPVWLPLISAILGILVGFSIQSFILLKCFK